MKKIKKLDDVVKNRIYKFIYNSGNWYIQRYLNKDDEGKYWFYIIKCEDDVRHNLIHKEMNCSPIHDCIRKMYELTRNEVIMEML